MPTVTSSSIVRTGIIGYGLAGAIFHAPLIAATPAMSVAAIVTRDRERAARAARDHPGAEIVDDVAWLWENARSLDLIVVASPNRTHVPLALASLQAGLPVVVDKPLAATVAEGRHLIDVARERGLLLTVFQNRRWDGDFLTVQRLLAADRLGAVARFESRFERWRPVPRAGWRELGEAAEAGGLLYDIGSHLIDQALTLFGRVTHVYAELDRRRPGVSADDDAFVALTHASGVRSHLWASVVAAAAGPRFRVLGSRAAYTKFGLDVQEAALKSGHGPGQDRWSEEPAAAWGQIDDGEKVERVATEPGAYQQFYKVVAAAIRGEGPPPVDPEEAVASLGVIEAAQLSARSAQVTAL